MPFVLLFLLLAALALAVAWAHGAFLRCPSCRKIGAWRFDTVGILMEEQAGEGEVHPHSLMRVCRSCGEEVLETWSSFEGRVLVPRRNAARRPSGPPPPRRPWYHLHFGPWCLLTFGFALYLMAYTQEENLRLAETAIFFTTLAGSACLFGAAFLEAKYQRQEDIAKRLREFELKHPRSR